jgi:hypothetical protein
VEVVVEPPEPTLMDMGVDLCGRNIAVSEHHLNGPQIGSMIQ